MKPKWQRARMLRALDYREEASFIGRTFWVEIGPPKRLNFETISVTCDDPANNDPCYRSNLLDNRSLPIYVDAASTELLPEFTNDVALLPWGDFCQWK